MERQKSASENEREKVHFVTGEHDLVEVTGTRSPVFLTAILWLITRRIPDQWELTAHFVSVRGCEITRRIPDQWELITRFVSVSGCQKEKTIAALQDHDRHRCYLLRGMISCYFWSQISLVSKKFAISTGTGCGVETENGFPFLISRPDEVDHVDSFAPIRLRAHDNVATWVSMITLPRG